MFDPAQAVSAASLFDSLDRSRFTARHGRLYAVLQAGHLVDGLQVAMMGFLLPGIAATFGTGPAQGGLLVSGTFIGALIGAASSGFIADRFGRKRAMMLCLGIFGVFSSAAAFAPSFSILALLRLLEGVGIGAEVSLLFTYLSEFMPSRQRGSLLAYSTCFYAAAGSVASLLAILVIPLFTWRGMLVIGATPAFLLIVLWIWMPESVRYLVGRNRLPEAAGIVRRLSTETPRMDITGPATAAPPRGQLREIFRNRYLRPTIGIWLMHSTMGLVFFGLSTWLPSLILRMGFDVVHSFAFTGLITLGSVFGNLACGYLIDRLGRIATITAFFLIGAVTMSLWGLAHSAVSIVAWGALTTFFGGGGLTGGLFAYTSELYPTRLRATATGLASATQRLAGIIAPLFFGFLFGLGVSNFAFFVVMSALLLVGGASAWLLGYETMGKSLETLERELGAPAS